MENEIIENKEDSKNDEIKLTNGIYFIFCFHRDIWKYNTIDFSCKDKQFSIQLIKTIVLESNPLSISKCFCINLGENIESPNKKFDLTISLNSRSNWDLTSISLKEKKSRFIFSDVKIAQKLVTNFINNLNSELNLNTIDNYNYCINVDINQKFIIFYNCLLDYEKNKNKNENNLNKTKENLASDFMYFIKNTKNYDLLFSTIAALFTLCYKNNNIFTNFLDLTEKLNLINDVFENESFIKIVENFENGKDYNSPLISINESKINKHEKFSLDKYTNLYEEFLLTYLLFYKKESIINKGLSVNTERVLMKLYKKKENKFISLLKFIINYF